MADPGLKYNPIVAYREITENGRVIKLQRVIVETESGGDAEAVTLVDKSYTFPDGLSHEILPANPNRGSLTILDPTWETARATIGPTGAAAVDGATPGITLFPGDEWTPRRPPKNAITAIGTAGHKIIVLEG